MKPVLEGRHGTGQPASTRFDPVILTVQVPSQDHLFYRRPHKVAEAFRGSSGYGVLVAAVVVIEPSGLTATYRADPEAAGANQ